MLKEAGTGKKGGWTKLKEVKRGKWRKQHGEEVKERHINNDGDGFSKADSF